MADVNLGLGQQKSIKHIIKLAEREVHRTQGAPGTVVASADNIVITGSRDAVDASFTAYEIQISESSLVDDGALDAAVNAHSDVAKCDKSNGVHINVGGDSTAVSEALEAITPALRLPEVWLVRGERFELKPVGVEMLFQAMVQYKASDCHLSPGEAPVFRVDGELHRSEVFAALTGQQIHDFIRIMAIDRYWEEFEAEHQTSFNFHQVGLGYARVSAFIKAGAPHCTLRFLPEKIPSFEDLRVPKDTMEELAGLHHGLILLTGMTGSGKSTTVAALVDWINTNRHAHILCIENPVEYVHRNKKSVVSQRTTGVDVADFSAAVRGALRHDPDVIVIGEMRDPDTIRSAINAAATGHLVISTLHSNTAYESINRVVSFFDPVERDLVRMQLRDAVRCIICQRLVPRVGGGRQPALEFMLNDTKAINDGIMSGQSDSIRIGMQQTQTHSFIFEDYIFRIYKEGLISLETAKAFATDSSVLEQMIMGTYTVPRLESIKHLHTE